MLEAASFFAPLSGEATSFFALAGGSSSTVISSSVLLLDDEVDSSPPEEADSSSFTAVEVSCFTSPVSCFTSQADDDAAPSPATGALCAGPRMTLIDKLDSESLVGSSAGVNPRSRVQRTSPSFPSALSKTLMRRIHCFGTSSVRTTLSPPSRIPIRCARNVPTVVMAATSVPLLTPDFCPSLPIAFAAQ